MSKSLAIGVLGTLLCHAFLFTNNIEYINEAILILREALNLLKMEHFEVVPSLINSLSACFNLHCSREDLNEIMQSYQMAVDHRGTNIPDWFKFSCQWVQHI